MSTTTIRLSDELKARVSRAAERAGTTAHGFILNAIEEKADQDEHRVDFHDVADRRYAAIAATGKTVPWTEMRRYLEDRLAGKSTAHPTAKKLVR
jgi:predicted transcriptional regulator